MAKEALRIENAVIFFKNFSGRETDYNSAGDRNFCVQIPDHEMAERLRADGWNVKITKPKSDEYEPVEYIKVNVRFGNYPPDIWTKRGKVRTKLTAENISLLDNAKIENVGLVSINPSFWNRNGKSGISGYLEKMFVTLANDPFEEMFFEDNEEDEIPFN